MTDNTFNSDIENPPLVEKWIIDSSPPPKLHCFPEELVLAVAYWCIDPQSLLNLSTTCNHLARILRTANCWLDHHLGRGYDIGVLAKKAKHAAATREKKFGPDGWGLLVKSAFDKAEFPDDEHLTQWNMGKPLPHVLTVKMKDPNAIDKYQPRGERWMRVLYDVLIEHERYNMEIYPWLHDEALSIRVKAAEYRYLQALISASHLLLRMWTEPVAAGVNQNSIQNAQMSLHEIPAHDHRCTSLSSLTWTFLVAHKIMEIVPEAQTQRRLYPHPPFGPSILEGPDGEVVPRGLGWIPKVREDWKGRVYVMGQFVKFTSDPHATPRLADAPIRMCLDFGPDGQITGRGGDFGGQFNIISGSYCNTFVELYKQYEDEEEDDDIDTYHATGHMTPWGVYGRWGDPEKPNKTLGYWCMWHFEGAPMVHLGVLVQLRDGRFVYPKQSPYKAVPGWFEEYERQRDAGTFVERQHGFWDDPPPLPEDVPLPDIDAYGL